MLIQHQGFACQIRADGVANSERLLKCLSNSFVFKTSEPMTRAHLSECCTFRVVYGPQMTHRNLERLLLEIPGVRLSVDSTATRGK